MLLRTLIFNPFIIIKTIKKFFQKHELIFILSFIFFLFLLTFISNFFLHDYYEFSELAWSFIHGKTYFLNQIDNIDAIKFNGQTYWNLPPMPAVLLMPIVLIFGPKIDHSIITFITNGLFFIFLFYFIKNKFDFNKINSLWLALAFFFGSIYINSTLAASPYGFSHVLTSLFLFLSFNEYLNKKRYWLIGIFIGMCFMTRYTLIFASLFYFILIIFDDGTLKKKLKNLITFILPLSVFGLSSLAYNYIRFANPLETGYRLSDFWFYFSALRPYGMFSLKYIPTNFYYYFLQSLDPYYINPADSTILTFPYVIKNATSIVSFFIISPLFLYLFKTNLRKKIIKSALLTSFVLIFFLLCYYFNGFSPQIGPRYLIDVLPFLFLILLYIFKETGFNYRHKAIILFSIILNLYLYFASLVLFP